MSASRAEHRVLIVDDQRQAQVLLARFLKRMGYAVEVASNGLEAVEAVARSRPDVVIMDVEMPLMSGFEATERIREMPGRWLPIVFLSATPDSAALIRALEKGGDDYLVKPIGYSVLRAKMRAVSRTLVLQRELELRNARLDAYKAAEEEQNLAAEHVIRRLASQELLDESVVQHWTAPANLFSGDLVAAALTPMGVLHVMVADGAGHGLAAALTALPVTQPFYRMSEKGYPLSRIVEEINRKIRKLLPVDRFVAATFIAIDFEDRLIEIEEQTAAEAKVILLRMKHVRNPDAVCLHLLDGFLERQERAGKLVALTGVRDDVIGALRNVGIAERLGPSRMFREVKEVWSSTMSAVHWAYEQLGESRCENCPHSQTLAKRETAGAESGWHFKL